MSGILRHTAREEIDCTFAYAPNGDFGWRVTDKCAPNDVAVRVKRIILYHENGGLGPELYLRVHHTDGRTTVVAARHMEVTF